MKVQNALVKLGFSVDSAERASKTYGSSTARAVLQFKSSWEIINRSYQAAADNIVGKMTIQELDDAMVSNIYFTLPPPPIVKQNVELQNKHFSCWAASLESWLTVSPQTQYTQDQLMEMFKPWEDPSNGGLTSNGWSEVSKKFSLEGTWGTGPELTAGFLQEKLRNKGFVLIVYNLVPQGPSHVSVVFGVRVRSSGKFVRVMDPFGEGELVERPLDFYTVRDFIGLLWAK